MMVHKGGGGVYRTHGIAQQKLNRSAILTYLPNVEKEFMDNQGKIIIIYQRIITGRACV